MINKSKKQLLEEIIQLKELLKERTKELESFSYSISHDLRAPLRAIIGFGEIINERYGDALNQEGRRYLNNIIESGSQMGQLIEDLLKYSRLGHRSVQKIPIPLEKIFKHVIGNLQGRIDECGGKVEIPEKMPVVMAGKTLLIQILTNLIENAVIYREPDIPLKITVKCEENNGWVIIGIADNGIGIAPEFQKKIFNVFQRLHSESEYPGTGIGLAIVKKSIEIMGGEVWVESSLGKGSAFYIKLRSAKKY